MKNKSWKVSRIFLASILGLITICATGYYGLTHVSHNIQQESQQQLKRILTGFKQVEEQQDAQALAYIKTTLTKRIDQVIKALNEDNKHNYHANIQQLLHKERIHNQFKYLAINDVSGKNLFYSIQRDLVNNIRLFYNTSINYKEKSSYMTLNNQLIRIVKDLLFINGEVYGTVIGGYTFDTSKIMDYAKAHHIHLIVLSKNKIGISNTSNAINRYLLDQYSSNTFTDLSKKIKRGYSHPIQIDKKSFWSHGTFHSNESIAIIALTQVPWQIQLLTWVNYNWLFLLLAIIGILFIINVINFVTSLYGKDVEFLHQKDISSPIQSKAPVSRRKKPQKSSPYLEKMTNVFATKTYSQIPDVQNVATKTIFTINETMAALGNPQQATTHTIKNKVISSTRKIEHTTILSIAIKGINYYTSQNVTPDILTLVQNSKEHERATIKKYGGIIQKDSGDELLAIYRGHHSTLSAIQSAYEIRNNIYSINLKNLLNLQFKAAINYGELTQLVLDNEILYTGNHLKLTDVLLTLKGQDEILITSLAYQTLNFNLPVTRLGTLKFKPIGIPVLIFSIKPDLKFETEEAKTPQSITAKIR